MSISKKVLIFSSKKALENGVEIHYVNLVLCFILLLCIRLNVTRTKYVVILVKS